MGNYGTETRKLIEPKLLLEAKRTDASIYFLSRPKSCLPAGL
jgi:hypothetical protein